MTAQKLTLAAFLAHKQYFDQLLDPVFAVDAEKNVLYANRAFCLFTGLTPARVKRAGKCSGCLPLSICESACIMHQARAEEKTINLREIAGRVREQDISIFYSATPLYADDGTFAGAVMNFQDKSDEAIVHVKYKETYRELQRAFDEALKVFGAIVELRNQQMALVSKRVAMSSKVVAQRMELSEEDVRAVEIAALLHQIGKVGIPDDLLEKDPEKLPEHDRERYQKYAVLGQASLGGIAALTPVGLLIRHHTERYDGRGHPDRLVGDAIPLGARVIAVCEGFYQKRARLGDTEEAQGFAIEYLRKQAGVRFDPRVVEVFVEHIEGHQSRIKQMQVQSLPVEQLAPGMRLARHLVTARGVLLLAEDEVVTPGIVQRILNFHEVDPVEGEVLIYVEQAGAAGVPEGGRPIPGSGAEIRRSSPASLSSSSNPSSNPNPSSTSDPPGDPRREAPSRGGRAAGPSGGTTAFGASRKRRILVVDSDAESTSVIERFLRGEGHEVTFIRHGREALRELKKTQFDALMLDLDLPDINGFEVLENVQAIGVERAPSVMVCTHRRSRDDVIRSLRFGAREYLVKPVEETELREKLERLLQQRRAS